MLKKAFKESFPGIVMSTVIPAILGYLVIPVPVDAMSNAINTGIGGAVSATLASVITLMVYMKKTENK